MYSPSFEELTGRTESHIHWLSETLGIHKEVISAFLAMQEAAKNDGIILSIASGFRSFERQLSIWNRKFSGELAIKNQANEIIDITPFSPEEIINAICLFSAIPGTSRHHWGTDIDVYAENLLPQQATLQLEPWEYMKEGYFQPLTAWLKENAKRFGFYLPYNEYTGGVAQEPWHLSYAPIASVNQQYFNMDTMIKSIKQSEILGKEIILANALTLFEQYINNVQISDININEVIFD